MSSSHGPYEEAKRRNLAGELEQAASHASYGGPKTPEGWEDLRDLLLDASTALSDAERMREAHDGALARVEKADAVARQEHRRANRLEALIHRARVYAEAEPTNEVLLSLLNPKQSTRGDTDD